MATKKHAPASEVRTSALPERMPLLGDPGVMSLAAIRPCAFNIRKQFPAADIQALADSIRAVGLKEPMLVRRIGEGGYELVDGERRYRALKLAGVTEAPVIVRNLTDAEVRAIMLTTREQSRDLLPSELAAGYKEAVDRDGKTLELIAAEVGQSVSHVRSVLALAKLPAWALAAVDAGDLPRRTAELVARIPSERGREECAAFVLCDELPPEKGDVGKWVAKNRADQAATYRDTVSVIANHFQIELKQATFSRKALDLVEGAGSCDDCPKRAGNNAEAKEAGTRADVCLDPYCFRAKTEEHNKRAVKLAKESGQTVLPAKEADSLFNSWGSHDLKYGTAYLDLDQKSYEDGAKGRTYKTLLKGIEPEKIVVAIDPAGTPRELVKAADAKKLLRAAGFGVATTPASGSKADQRWKAEEAKRRKDKEAENVAAQKACGIVAERVLGLVDAGDEWMPIELLRPLVVAVIDAVWSDANRIVAKRRELGKGSPRDLVAALAAKLDTVPDLMALAAEVLAAKRALFGFGGLSAGHDEKQFWKAFGIEPKKLIQEARAEQKKPARFKPDYDAIERDAKLGTEKPAKAKAKPASGKSSKNDAKHKPACSMESALADGLPNGLPAKLPSIAKPLRSIPGFPRTLATELEKVGRGTDIAFSEFVNKQKTGSHADKIEHALSLNVPATMAEIIAGKEAFLNYIYPGRAKKVGESNGKAGTGTIADAAKPAGSLPIADVPGFPPEAVGTLAQGKVWTLADLEPYVEAQKHKDSPIFEALRKLGLAGSPHLFAAGDALVEHLMFDFGEESGKPKPRRKEKAKS